MLELILCSLVTVLPDYLFRSRVQGKRWGEEINFFTLWYELRWGITLCAMLTITLITIVFYFHPQTSSVASFFRTVTILSETGGRVAEVYVRNNEEVEAGQPIFRLDGSSQEAAAETARRRIAEVDAALALSVAQRDEAQASIEQAQAQLTQLQADLERQRSLFERGSSVVSERDVELLQNQVDGGAAAVAAAQAGLEAVNLRSTVELPAQRASAEAQLAQTENEIAKLTVYAGVTGRVEQFALQPGDIVNPILRPAGILVPQGSGRNRFQAGFGQVTTQVIQPGGVGEMICMSKPFTVIPMVITEVQDVIAAGQLRPSDQLVDAQALPPPGSVTAFMEPIYPGTTDDIPPGSRCIANAYSNFHDQLENDESLGTGHRIFLHVVDTVGLIHAAGLRIQSLLMPFNMLVFTGH